jgi:hypothetical protein
MMILSSRRSPGLYRPRPENTERPAPPTLVIVPTHAWLSERLPVLANQPKRQEVNFGKLAAPDWASASRRDTTAPVDPGRATAQRR